MIFLSVSWHLIGYVVSLWLKIVTYTRGWANGRFIGKVTWYNAVQWSTCQVLVKGKKKITNLISNVW